MFDFNKLIAAGVLTLAMGVSGAIAQDKVSFGTNWLAQAEHGGYYQAVADGTYAKYGLDVTIRQGGPQGANRSLLIGGQDRVLHGRADHRDRRREGRHPDPHARRDLPEGSAGAAGAPGCRLRDLRGPRQGRQVHHLQGRLHLLFRLDEDGLRGLHRRAVQALHLQPGAVHRRQAGDPAGLRHLRALRDREADRLGAEGVPARRQRLRPLFDDDRGDARPWYDAKHGRRPSASSMPRSSAGTTTSMATTPPPTS